VTTIQINHKKKRRSEWEYFHGLIVGLIAGWLAGLVVKGGGFGCVGDIIVGVIGGLLGGWIASHFFHMGDAIVRYQLSIDSGCFCGGRNTGNYITRRKW